MRSRRQPAVLALLLGLAFWIASPVIAEEPTTHTLSLLYPGESAIQPDTPYEFQLTDVLPATEYTISIDVIAATVKAFSLGDLGLGAGESGAGPQGTLERLRSQTCKALGQTLLHASSEEALSALLIQAHAGVLQETVWADKTGEEVATIEGKIAGGDAATDQPTTEMKQLIESLRKAAPPPCTDVIEQVEAARTTALSGLAVSYPEGTVIDVTVTRDADASRKRVAKEWSFEITVGETRRWLVHYGFGFVENDDEEYFAKARSADDGGGFVITPQGDEEDLDLQPLLTFTYIPDIRTSKHFRLGLSAGLGLDIADDPMVFFGPSVVIGDNVNVFFGGAVRETSRLRGTYTLGQELQDAIEADQLVEDTFSASFIVGVGFRFDGNPFKKKEPQVVQTAKPADQASTPKDPNPDPGPTVDGGPPTEGADDDGGSGGQAGTDAGGGGAES